MKAVGYRGPVPDARQMLARMRARGVVAAFVRADRVYGPDHLALAALLAHRAMEEGRARSADLATEVLVYVAGERQIGRALAHVGLPDGADAVAVAHLEGPLDEAAAAEGWTRDDRVLEGTEEVLDAFRIGASERALIPRARWGDLVLEKVALVDVLKA